MSRNDCFRRRVRVDDPADLRAREVGRAALRGARDGGDRAARPQRRRALPRLGKPRADSARQIHGRDQ